MKVGMQVDALKVGTEKKKYVWGRGDIISVEQDKVLVRFQNEKKKQAR